MDTVHTGFPNFDLQSNGTQNSKKKIKKQTPWIWGVTIIYSIFFVYIIKFMTCFELLVINFLYCNYIIFVLYLYF